MDISDMRNQIICGDAIETLKAMADECVDCCVSSPPYWGLRDYGVDGQIGLEPTLDEFIDRLTQVFQEVKRVLKPDGTIWVNMGDAFESKQLIGQPWRLAFALQADGWYLRSDIIWSKPNPMPESVTDRPTMAHEYLFLMSKNPRYYYDADAVREEAVYEGDKRHLRTDVSKLAGNPREDNGSHAKTGNPTQGRNKRTVWEIATQAVPDAHFATFPEKLIEPCILAGTSERGYCSECGRPWVRVTEKPPAPMDVFTKRTAPEDGKIHSGSWVGGKLRGHGQKLQNWRDEHPSLTIGWEATCECRADTVPGVVLDPFMGSGTTALVAHRLDRDFVGIELSPEYCEIARKRIGEEVSQGRLFAQ